MYVWVTDSPVGRLTLTASEAGLTGLFFGDTRETLGSAQTLEQALPFPVLEQLAEYFSGKRRVFDLPLDMESQGTAFQLRCWKALGDIPYGQTVSYKELAQAVGSPQAFRAVGQANHNNPISIIIPCHRVICADGSLGGYGGGLAVKRQLLTLEGFLS